MIRLERKHGVVLLDDEDAWVTQKYRISTAKFRPGHYVNVVAYEVGSSRKFFRLGRLLLGLGDSKMQVDHINNDPLDNRRDNLRAVDTDLQSANRRSTNENGYKGVSLLKDGRARPYRGKFKRLGIEYVGPHRGTADQAALDYNKMAISVWGRQVVLNEVRCVSMEPKPSQKNCMFCNAPCHCCCVCFDPPSPGMKRLFDALDASYRV